MLHHMHSQTLLHRPQRLPTRSIKLVKSRPLHNISLLRPIAPPHLPHKGQALLLLLRHLYQARSTGHLSMSMVDLLRHWRDHLRLQRLLQTTFRLPARSHPPTTRALLPLHLARGSPLLMPFHQTLALQQSMLALQRLLQAVTVQSRDLSLTTARLLVTPRPTTRNMASHPLPILRPLGSALRPQPIRTRCLKHSRIDTTIANVSTT